MSLSKGKGTTPRNAAGCYYWLRSLGKVNEVSKEEFDIELPTEKQIEENPNSALMHIQEQLKSGNVLTLTLSLTLTRTLNGHAGAIRERRDCGQSCSAGSAQGSGQG